MTLEFLEQQQAFHNNYGDHKENSNGYQTIFAGAMAEIDKLQPLVEKVKEIRDNGFLTFERAKQIISGK